jgi:hypothetical protein
MAEVAQVPGGALQMEDLFPGLIAADGQELGVPLFQGDEAGGLDAERAERGGGSGLGRVGGFPLPERFIQGLAERGLAGLDFAKLGPGGGLDGSGFGAA